MKTYLLFFCALLTLGIRSYIQVSNENKQEYPETFTLWQLPSQINTIGNSYVIQTADGQVLQ